MSKSTDPIDSENNPTSGRSAQSFWVRVGAWVLNKHVTWIVLFLTLSVTFWVWKSAEEELAQARQVRFENRASEVSNAVLERMGLYEQVLRGGIGLFVASGSVTRTEFKEYVASLKIQERYPGMQGFGFSVHIPAAHLDAHLSTIRAEGFPDYAIRPAGVRAEYTSIIYLEPFDLRNQRAFGFDMFSEAIRRAAMSRARDTGDTSISSKVKLVQETSEDVQAGILMYLPYYKNGTPHNTLAERRANLVGYVYSPFRLNDLMSGILGKQQTDAEPDIDIEVYDGTVRSAESLLYDDDSIAHALGTPPPGSLTFTRSIDLYGQTWSLYFTTRPAFDAAFDNNKPLLNLLYGIVLSAMLSGLIWMFAIQRRRTLELASDLTSDLRASETILSATIDTALDAVVRMDSAGMIIGWNIQAEKMFGWTREEAIGRMLNETIIPPQHREAHLRGIRHFLATGEGPALNQRIEITALHRNGHEFPIELSITPLKVADKHEFSAFIRDITEFKEFEMRNALLVAIVTSSDDAIVSYNLDGIYTSWNLAAERLFGYSADEMIGQPIFILVSSKDANSVANILGEIRKGQQIASYEAMRLRKDGSEVPVLMTVSAIYDLTGAVIGGSTICQDITEQKRATQNADRMALIIKSSNDAMVSVDLEGTIMSLNPAAEHMYGYSIEEAVGQSVDILNHPDSPYQFVYVRDMLQTGSLMNNLEALRARKDGSTFYASLTVSPIFDATGVMIGSASISRDLTERKLAFQNAIRMASIIESSNDAIVSESLDGIITSWNPAAERLYGYTADEMIGQSFFVLVPSENEATDILGKIRKGQPITHFETVRLGKDGSAVPVSLTLSPLYDSTGALSGASGIYRDMTELKKAEHRFHMIVESAPDAMVIVDKTGTITIVNSQTEKMFGYRRDELLGQPMELLLPSRFHANIRSFMDRYFANPQVRPIGVEWELYGRRKDGQEFPEEINLSPIETADGILLATIIHDVTEHKQMIRRLEEMNELRNEFVAVVAHDLRSPMMSISGFAQELVNGWDASDDATKIKYLQIIVRNTEHLAGFVEDVLQVARIEAGEYTYDIRPFDIRSLVQRALDETASASGGQRFEFTVLGDIPTVLGDEERQLQILTNLLSNAVKFSPAEEPIVVGLSRIDDSVQVTVTDRGIGIATDDQTKLFKKFGRVSNLGVRKVPGNGLGLYICKTLVEAQGGRIWCESSPGRGSTFTFTVPVAR